MRHLYKRLLYYKLKIKLFKHINFTSIAFKSFGLILCGYSLLNMKKKRVYLENGNYIINNGNYK